MVVLLLAGGVARVGGGPATELRGGRGGGGLIGGRGQGVVGGLGGKVHSANKYSVKVGFT